jgi:hypothetical protein
VAKPPSPLVGFNNNVKHKGRIFHVQTEDSGVNRPHIVTHLFADGGRIIKSTRTDYSEHVGRPDMSAVVRRLMKEQHKAMFIALRDGRLDETIEQVTGPLSDQPAAELPPLSVPPASPSKRRSRPPPTLTDVPAASQAPKPVQPAVAEAPHARRAAPTLTDLVLADLEAARARGPVPVPPPASSGKPAGPKGTPTLGTPALHSRPPPSAGRYGASRPAAIFTPPNPEPASSIFGGSSISEQSLDEVILSYLAEDLDGAPED